MSGRWRHTFLAVKVGQVEYFPLMMALRRVDLAGLKHAACRKIINSAIVLFSRIKFALPRIRLGLGCVMVEKLRGLMVDGACCKCDAHNPSWSRDTVRTVAPLWVMRNLSAPKRAVQM